MAHVTKPPRLYLLKSCATCRHFDGDVHCSIIGLKLIGGFIADPKRVVCDQHELEDIAGAPV